MANLASFDLNLLRVLDAMLREGSTVAAARRLGQSQPAVSAALGRLRLTLDDPLFLRRGQGLEPTAHALSLQGPLRVVLDHIETLLQGPAPFDPATSDARFRIAGSDFFAEMLMPVLAESLSGTAPGLRIHLIEPASDNYVQSLNRFHADLALLPRQPLPDWVERQAVFRSGFSVIARRGHPAIARTGARHGDVIPIDVFCELGHVMFSPEGNERAMGDAALAQVGRTRRVVMTMPVFSGVIRAVAQSELIALLPQQLARHVAASSGLDVFDPPMPIPIAQIDMIWPQRVSANPAHAWLRNLIAELLASLDIAD